MLELAAYAQITEAADLNQQECQQRQAECDIDICSDRPDPKQPQRASDQDIEEDRSHIRREGLRFAAEIALGIIVDFFDNQLCGNLQKQREIAKNMKTKNISIADIAEMTGLPVEEIEKL